MEVELSICITSPPLLSHKPFLHKPFINTSIVAKSILWKTDTYNFYSVYRSRFDIYNHLTAPSGDTHFNFAFISLNTFNANKWSSSWAKPLTVKAP